VFASFVKFHTGIVLLHFVLCCRSRTKHHPEGMRENELHLYVLCSQDEAA
jgi:uncharacterized membrane protein YdcZ (DUF606 family)